MMKKMFFCLYVVGMFILGCGSDGINMETYLMESKRSIGWTIKNFMKMPDQMDSLPFTVTEAYTSTWVISLKMNLHNTSEGMELSLKPFNAQDVVQQVIVMSGDIYYSGSDHAYICEQQFYNVTVSPSRSVQIDTLSEKEYREFGNDLAMAFQLRSVTPFTTLTN